MRAGRTGTVRGRPAPLVSGTSRHGGPGGDHPPLVVVLGASGFIGSAVTRVLARRRIRLRAVARRPTHVPVHTRAEVDVRTADLTDRDALAEVVAGADVVVHLVAHISETQGWRVAAEDPAVWRTNVGTVHDLVDVLRSGRGGGQLPAVVAASTTAPDELPGNRLDGGRCAGANASYYRHKLLVEEALARATAEGVLRGVPLRLPTVFGQGADKGVISAMVRRALAGEPLTLWHDGAVRRDLCHVDDVARAFVAAVDHVDRLAGVPWAFGTGRLTALGEVFGTIAEIVSAAIGRPPVPVVTVPPPDYAQSSDFRDIVVDPSPFRAATGWRPALSLRQGLVRTVTHLRDSHPSR